MSEKSRTGSTRVMTPVEPGIIALQYTDRWSAFDRGSSDQLIPGIGAARCACAVKSFELAAKSGLPTHFIEQVAPDTIHVMEFSVPGHEPLSGKVHGCVLDAEWIWRMFAYGSLLERLRNGSADPTDFGFAAGTEVTEGMKLPRMLIERTTKFEAVDRHLSEGEARTRLGIMEEQENDARQLIIGAVTVTNAAYDAAGFMCPDGKLELGLLHNGSIILVDVFATQDENRIIDKVTGGIFSKDLIRNWLNKQPWKAELTKAKAEYPGDKSKWPPYPELPADLVELVSNRYRDVAFQYAGVNITQF